MGGHCPPKMDTSARVLFRRLQFSITTNEVVRRTVVFKPGGGLAFQFGDDPLRQNFSEFNAPLIKRINVPNHALREDAVFVKSDEFAESFRREPVGEDDV